jgi:Zn-dependent M28 family amino/carboxypeptidase
MMRAARLAATFPLSLLPLLSPLSAQAPAEDARVRQIVSAVSAQRLEGDLRKLVSFGTRHTASDTVSPTRGIGAARRWLKAEFDRIAAACGGCLEVSYVGEVWTNQRLPRPTNVVNVVAVQRGATDPGRYLVMSGHYDSRVSDVMNAADSAPGANDDGSGTVAVLEAARVLSRHRFHATIVYAALAGEEQGLNGGQTLARLARNQGWRIAGVLNNDIVGNTRGADGIHEDTTVRVFSDGTPPTETEAERLRRRSTGGEVDGASRQLARYVDRIAQRFVPRLDVWMIYRLDRFGRGGDHRAFADEGFPAVRLSETHEHYDRQHQNIRVENGVAYGDVLEGVDFPYLAKVTALNAAALASLAWAPGAPRNVRVTGAVRPAAVLSWQPPADSANVVGYRVYWRRTDAPTWDQAAWAGTATTHTFSGLVIDNYFFGVASVSREGHESPVVFPGAGGPGGN